MNETIDKQQRRHLLRLLRQQHVEQDRLSDWLFITLNIASMRDITRDQYQRVVAWILSHRHA